MPSPGLPAILETIDEHAGKIRNLTLPVQRERLRWDHIRKLDREEASDLLERILEAKTKLRGLSWRLRDCREACVLRGLLAMAEKDLRETLHIPPEILPQGFPRKPRIKRNERARGRGRGGYL